MAVPIKIKFSPPRDWNQHVDRLNSAFSQWHEHLSKQEQRIADLEQRLAALEASSSGTA